MRNRLIYISVVIFLQAHCSNVSKKAQPTNKVFEITDCKSPAGARKGDTLLVKRTGKPGTGYGWHIHTPENYEKGIRFLGKSGSGKVADLDDAPGLSVFRFVIIEPGEYTINLRYRRSGANQEAAALCDIAIAAQ